MNLPWLLFALWIKPTLLTKASTTQLLPPPVRSHFLPLSSTCPLPKPLYAVEVKSMEEDRPGFESEFCHLLDVEVCKQISSLL